MSVVDLAAHVRNLKSFAAAAASLRELPELLRLRLLRLAARHTSRSKT
jgi:hypothetical protein